MLNEEYWDYFSVEDLVLIIQDAERNKEDYDEFDINTAWDLLYKKTKNAIFQVFHKHVAIHYKKTMKDDIMAILKTGWVKAVFKYDIDKDKTMTCFVPFAQFVMYQEYVITFKKRHTPNKDGVSVKEVLINSVNAAKAIITEDEKRNKNSIVEIIEIDEKASSDYNTLELKMYIKEKLEILKTYYPSNYNMIIEYYFNEKTQHRIASQYNMTQSTISRLLKKGENFLRIIIDEDELYI